MPNSLNWTMDKKQAFASGMPDTSGTLIGTPKFKDGGQEFESKELKYNFETGKGFVKEIITQEGDGYVQGKLIQTNVRLDLLCERRLVYNL